MMVDLQTIVPWLALALSALSLIYTSRRDRSQATEQKLKDMDAFVDSRASKAQADAISEKVDKLEDRATRLESELKHLPDHSTVNRLETKIADLSSQVGVLAERIRPVAAIADRLQEKILESAGG